MAEFSFTGRSGATNTIDTATNRASGGAQWARDPGGIYSRTDAAGQNVWIDPRTGTATDAPMEGFFTGRGGGQFFTDPTTGFRLTETGDVWSGQYGTQRVLPATQEGGLQQVLYGDQQLYIDQYGVMREGATPSAAGVPPTGGATVGAPISGDISRGGAPGYPSVGAGGLISGGTSGTGGAPGPTTQGGTPGQGEIPVATPHILGQIQPVTPQPTASAVLSDPIQGRLEELRGPQEQFAPQTGMTNEMDVNWQMNRILSADNPLIGRAMEQARRDVQSEMNARGLLNTTMAVEIAEQAAMDAAYNIALPMANEAAKAEQQLAGANLQARAAFQQTGMQLQSQEAQQRAQLASGEIIQNLVNNNQITLGEIDRITRLQGIQLSEENKRYLTELTESNKLALQTNASVATAYSNTVSSIGQVYSNPEMTSQQQNTASRWYMDQFEGYVNFQDIVNETNYSEQMNWGGSGTQTQVEQLQQQIDQQGQAAGAFYPFGEPGNAFGQSRQFGNQEYRWYADGWKPVSSGSGFQF